MADRLAARVPDDGGAERIVTTATSFTVPPALLAALRTPWREAMAVRDDRRDAALIARIYRRVPLDCCPGDESESALRAARNRIARGNARRFVRSQKFQRAGVA